jgi:hypothetical protein
MRAGIILTVKEGIIKYVDPKRQAEASLPNSPLRHAIASSQEVEEYIQYKIEQFSTAKERIAHLTSELRENPISGQDEDNEKKKKKGTTTTTTTTDGRPDDDRTTSNPGDTSPPCRIDKIKLYNKIDPISYAKTLLGDSEFPEWVSEDISEETLYGGFLPLKDKLHHTLYRNNKEDPFVWLPYQTSVLFPTTTTTTTTNTTTNHNNENAKSSVCSDPRLPGIRPHGYRLYVTVANRLDYLERLICRLESAGNETDETGQSLSDSEAFRNLILSLRSFQDRYQLISLHMELKNQYLDHELFAEVDIFEGNRRYKRDDPERCTQDLHFDYTISPFSMFPPTERSVFDLEEVPDLPLIAYCQFWGGSVDLPVKDPAMVELIDMLSKALPFACKGRSVTSILPNKWMKHENVTKNVTIYRVMCRLIIASLLGCYPHCKITANFHVRRKTYRDFYLISPDPDVLAQWISNNKYLIVYIMREYLLYYIQLLPGINIYMMENYYWGSIVQNTFQGMDDIRERTNKISLQRDRYGVMPVSLLRDNMFETIWDTFISESVYFSLDRGDDVYESSLLPDRTPKNTNTTTNETKHQKLEENNDTNNNHTQQPQQQQSSANRIIDDDQPHRITKKRLKVEYDSLVVKEEISKYDAVYLKEDEWLARMNGVLEEYHKINLERSHRPIEMSFLDKMVQIATNLVDENYTGKRNKKRKRRSKKSLSGLPKGVPVFSQKTPQEKVFTNLTARFLSEIVARYDSEEYLEVPYLSLLFPPISISWETVNKLLYAELMYSTETSRSEIEKALEDIYYEFPYDFDVLFCFITLLKKKKSLSWYPAPRHFAERQLQAYAKRLGLKLKADEHTPEELIPYYCGMYLYCPTCNKIKTNIHPYNTKVSRTKDSSLCSEGVCIDMETGEFTCAKISSKNNPKKRSSNNNIINNLMNNVAFAQQANKKKGTTDENLSEIIPDMLDELIAAEVANSVMVNETKEAKKASKLKRRNDIMTTCTSTKLVGFNLIGGIVATKKDLVVICPECAVVTTLSRNNFVNSGSVLSCGCFRIKYKTSISCRVCRRETEKPFYRLVYDDVDTERPRLRYVGLCDSHKSDWLLHKDRFVALSSIVEKIENNYYVVPLADGDCIFKEKEWNNKRGGWIRSKPRINRAKI